MRLAHRGGSLLHPSGHRADQYRGEPAQRAGVTGQTSPINGNPDNTPVYLGTSGTGGTAKDAVHVDWAGITAGTAITPNYAIPGNSWPNATQMLAWPVIFATGNLSLNGGSTDSKGILIVTGNLTMGGSYRHEGIVLVGGTLTPNGNNQIHGA